MESFEDVEKLVEDLEAGTLERRVVLKRLKQAVDFLLQVVAHLISVQNKITGDPTSQFMEHVNSKRR